MLFHVVNAGSAYAETESTTRDTIPWYQSAFDLSTPNQLKTSGRLSANVHHLGRVSSSEKYLRSFANLKQTRD